MPKFNKTRVDHIVLNIKDVLDESLPAIDLGILVILECISNDGIVYESNLVRFIEEDNEERAREICELFGFTIYQESGDVKPKKSVTPTKIFSIPAVESVFEYMKEIGIQDPEKTSEKFIAYYNSNGWMVGKTKMKDWKSACVNWKGRQIESQTSQAPDGMVKVYPRGSQKTILIKKEDYERSVTSGTNYYKLTT
jgi:hypothetical protein